MVSLSLAGGGSSISLPSALPSFKPISLEDTQRELYGKTAIGRVGDASVVQLSENAFRLKLEKHIDDYQKGRGEASKRTGVDIGSRHLNNGSDLGLIDPKAASAYSAYSTTFSYGSAARFTAGVYQSTEQVKRIHDSLAKEDGLKHYYESLVQTVESNKQDNLKSAEVVQPDKPKEAQPS